MTVWANVKLSESYPKFTSIFYADGGKSSANSYSLMTHIDGCKKADKS